MRWLYKKNLTNTARYILGEYDTKSARTLICMGINPSTAKPNKLDSTLKKVKAIAKANSYSNWFMINVYPQRATNPEQLSSTVKYKLHNKNLKKIKKLLCTFRNADILYAYGDLISIHPYLTSCLSDIKNLINNVNFSGQHYCIKRTKKGNPIHPLYQKTDTIFIPYQC